MLKHGLWNNLNSWVMRTHVWFQSKLHLLHLKVRAITFMNVVLPSPQGSLLPDLSSQ